MPVEIDLDHLPPFSKTHTGKLKTIREQFRLTPDEIAPRVEHTVLMNAQRHFYVNTITQVIFGRFEI